MFWCHRWDLQPSIHMKISQKCFTFFIWQMIKKCQLFWDTRYIIYWKLQLLFLCDTKIEPRITEYRQFKHDKSCTFAFVQDNALVWICKRATVITVKFLDKYGIKRSRKYYICHSNTYIWFHVKIISHFASVNFFMTHTVFWMPLSHGIFILQRALSYPCMAFSWRQRYCSF